MARCDTSRRAMSLLELTAVVAISGLLALAGITSYGSSTLATGGAEGFARKLSLALVHARRSTISTGDNHYLLLSVPSSNVTGFTLYRRIGKGDVQVDQTWAVPKDVVVTSKATTLEFDFEGSALGGYSISVAGPDRSWSVSVVALTGAVRVTETTP
ncbi:MAG: type II secretion system protein [Planctomycetes bacterium]|nr:type II secretion system protein [Planctomycetota bacterium]